jgi:uncharacterized membrane protein YeaQ/YmgE (transglycosylase-associated protein family)
MLTPLVDRTCDGSLLDDILGQAGKRFGGRQGRAASVTGGRMLGFLWAIIVGLVVGALAKLIMPGRDPGGIIVTILLGVAGSLVANFLGTAVGWYGPGEAPGFLMSLLGAILLLWVYRTVRTRQRTA